MAKHEEHKPPTVVEEMEALVVSIEAASAQVKTGNKTHIDAVGPKLDEFAAKLKAILERKTS